MFFFNSSFQNLTFTKILTLKEMEFPHLGEHCSEPSCHTLGKIEIVYKKVSIQVHLLFEKFEL